MISAFKRPWHGLAALLALAPLFLFAEVVQPTAKVVSLDGSADFLKKGESFWKPVALGQLVEVGDQIKTGNYCRLGLLFSDQTLLRLNANSEFSLQPRKDPADNLFVKLVKGQLFYSVPQKPLVSQIQTPTVNAAIRGTEFVLTAVGPTESWLQVVEGAVLTEHAEGETLVDPKQSYTFTSKGASPRTVLVQPRDLVQWCLSFPVVVTQRELAQAGETTARLNQAFQDSANRAYDARAHYLDLDAAELTPAEKTIQAGWLLEVGEADRARKTLESQSDYAPALAQLAVVNIVLNDLPAAEQALEKAQKAGADRLSVLLATSYVRQAQLKLEEARDAARKATELDPTEPQAWARLAEMWLAIGEQDKALEASTKGLETAPGDARILMADGFVQLANAQADVAMGRFQKAIQQDSSLGLAHLGLGLALIRKNHLPEGRAEIQVGALLEPTNATLRSYLGKALLEEQIDRPYASWRTDRGKPAEKEFALAKQLDPNDPTPWYYDATRLQRENRLVDALENYEKAQELNNNRAVYRSKLLLDQDVASRSNKLGEVYQDLNMDRQATLSFSRSILLDPTNYGAYASFPNTSETGRLSNQVKALSLAPANANRVGGLNDFDNIFERDDYHRRLFTGSTTQNGDLSATTQFFGNFPNLSYAVGFGWTDIRALNGKVSPVGGINDENNFSRVQRSILVYAPNYKDSFLFDISPPEIDRQAVYVYGTPPDYLEQKSQRYTFSYRHKFDSKSTIIVGDSIDQVNRYDTLPGTSYDHFVQRDRLYNGFLEYLFVDPNNVNVESGIDMSYLHSEDASYPGREPLMGWTVYTYPTWQLSDVLRLTTGSGLTHQENNLYTPGILVNRYQNTTVTPKVGLWWDATPHTVFRAAVFRNEMANPNSLRLEPSLIEGFSQVADLPQTFILNEIEASLQQELAKNIFLGGMVGIGNDHVRVTAFDGIGSLTTAPDNSDIYFGDAWLEAVVTKYYTTALRYDQASTRGVSSDQSFRQVRLQNYLFSACGWSLDTDLVYQENESKVFGAIFPDSRDHDLFLNAYIKYHRPYQDWEVTAGVENINRQALDELWRLTVKARF